MVNKKILLLGILFGVFLFSSYVSAFSCSLKTTPDSADSIVLGLSEDANAHGEVRDGGGNYNYFISCDFEGTDKCSGSNGVLSLSSKTNAHAELLDEGNYNTDVCFGALECRSGAGITCQGDEFSVVSFSDTTNAHLGAFEDYSYKVCCNWFASAYFADPNDYLTHKSVVAVGDRVALVLNNSGLSLGDYEGFEIFENDGVVDDEILPRVDGQDILGDVFSSNTGSILLGVWEVTQDDYEAGKDLLLESSPDEFYFTINGVTSSYLNIISRDESVAFCEEFEEENLCSSCSNSEDCSAAYNSANEVSEKTYGVGCGETLLEDGNYKTNCFCQWDSNEDSCNSGVSYVSIDSKTVEPHCKNNETDEDEEGVDCGGDDCGICVNGEAVEHCKNNEEDYFGDGNLSNEEGIDCGGDDCGKCTYSVSFPKIGSCNYVSQGEDDCSDGFLEYNWLGQWDWGANNGFVSTDNIFSNDPNDYVENEGMYFYDPLRMSENCNSGSNTITCPASVELPFFGAFGFIVSFVLIGLIYLSLIFKNMKTL